MRATEQAAFYVRQMVQDENRGWGDEAGALRRIANNSRVPFWTLNNLRINRAKTIDADLMGRIREYFIQHCQRHAGRLLEQAEIAQRVAPGNDELRTVADQIRALALRLENAKGDPKGAVIPRQE